MPAQVLFIDDDPLLLASLGRCLRGQYELETFDSATNALAYLETEGEVPVIVTDMRMPVMDGAEFVMKAKEVAPSTQFLMLTGTPNDEQRIRREHGEIVSAFMSKPCNPAHISGEIDKALAVYNAEDASLASHGV